LSINLENSVGGLLFEHQFRK